MFRPVLEAAYRGDASPRKAIKAFCLECVGYDRKAISGCTAPSCPLWLYRPYQNEGATAKTEPDDGLALAVQEGAFYKRGK